jgi:hypothetical protein
MGCRWVVAVLVSLSLAAGSSGCNRGHHPVPSTTATSVTTATTVPVPTGPALSVRPPTGPVGSTVTFTATGFHPGETLRFEIRMPDGKIFKGQLHQVPGSGTVTAPYNTTGNPPGGYTVSGATEKGARAQATFTLTPASSSTTRPPGSSTITTGKPASTPTR